MAKANLTLPDGTTVVIEGTSEEVASLIHRFSSAQERAAPPRRGAAPRRRAEPAGTKPQTRGAIAYIRELIGEDFFHEERSIGDVRAALAARAHIYPVTTLSPAMFRLVRGRELRRDKDKNDGQWKYVNP